VHFASIGSFASIDAPQLAALPRGAWVLAGPALLFLYYWIAWWRIGPEPEPGPLVARYEPPAGLSAAAVRYAAYGTTDGRSFAAVIAQLAAAGCIRAEPIDGKYRLSRLMCGRDAVATLAPEEKRVLALLFEDAPVIELSPSMEERNAAQNGRYIFHIHEELAKQYRGKYSTRHSGIIALGVLATFALALPLAATTTTGLDAFGAIFLTVWILFCGLILGLLVEVSLIPAWHNALRSGVGVLKLLPGTVVVGAFVGIIGFLMTKLSRGQSPYLAAMLTSFLLINLAWAPLLKRRSPLGRQIADEIAGFRQFLQAVEHDPLNRIDPDEQLPRKLDRYLPFAIALEVKAAWGDHLTQTFFASTVMVED
jgi:hypothetical protein